MSLSPEELAYWDRFYEAHFDRVGREGSYEPPPSDAASSDRSCTPTGLLTPSRDDHGQARPTRIESKNQSRSVRIQPALDNSVEEFKQWLASIPKPAPDVFRRLGKSNTYVYWSEGLGYDWKRRSSRSKRWKQPYLFALDFSGDSAGEPAIAVLGGDIAPSELPHLASRSKT